MRFLMVLGVVLFLPLAAMGSELTISVGPVMRPMPKFVQNLTDAQYKCWATWQNRQATAKRAKGALSVPEMPYTTVERSTATVTGALSRDSRSKHGSRRGSEFERTLTVDTGTVSYLNPQYSAPPGDIYLNPFARVKGGMGTPDWGALYVPFEGEVMTVSEALDKFNGPINPEALFAEGMEPYFSE